MNSASTKDHVIMCTFQSKSHDAGIQQGRRGWNKVINLRFCSFMEGLVPSPRRPCVPALVPSLPSSPGHHPLSVAHIPSCSSTRFVPPDFLTILCDWGCLWVSKFSEVMTSISETFHASSSIPMPTMPAAIFLRTLTTLRQKQ